MLGGKNSVPIVDPHSFEVLPYGDRTAWIDFLGQHELQHREFASAIRAAGKASYPLLPLGDGGGDEWHQAHQLVHQGETSSLGIASSPDFTAYDLDDANDFSTWTFLHALQHVTIRKQLGL